MWWIHWMTWQQCFMTKSEEELAKTDQNFMQLTSSRGSSSCRSISAACTWPQQQSRHTLLLLAISRTNGRTDSLITWTYLESSHIENRISRVPLRPCQSSSVRCLDGACLSRCLSVSPNDLVLHPHPTMVAILRMLGLGLFVGEVLSAVISYTPIQLMHSLVTSIFNSFEWQERRMAVKTSYKYPAKFLF